MRIVKIGHSDLNAENEITKNIPFECSLEIAPGLGQVKFNSITVKGYILAEAGSGIESEEWIKAEQWIKAGGGIKADRGIEAGGWIEANGQIEAGEGIKSGWSLHSGKGIIAGEGIKAGDQIEAGWGIEAGGQIEAGWGIIAGLHITCKTLNCKLRIFVGTANWKTVNQNERTLTCEDYTGELACGTFKKISCDF